MTVTQASLLRVPLWPDDGAEIYVNPAHVATITDLPALPASPLAGDPYGAKPPAATIVMATGAEHIVCGPAEEVAAALNDRYHFYRYPDRATGKKSGKTSS